MLEYSNQVFTDNYNIKIDDTFTLSQAEVIDKCFISVLL